MVEHRRIHSLRFVCLLLIRLPSSWGFNDVPAVEGLLAHRTPPLRCEAPTPTAACQLGKVRNAIMRDNEATNGKLAPRGPIPGRSPDACKMDSVRDTRGPF